MEVKVRQAPSGGLVRYFERFCSIVFFTGFDHPVDDPYELVGTSHDPFGFTQPHPLLITPGWEKETNKGLPCSP